VEPTPTLDIQSSDQQEYVLFLASDYSMARSSYNSSQPVRHFSRGSVPRQDQMNRMQHLNPVVYTNDVNDNFVSPQDYGNIYRPTESRTDKLPIKTHDVGGRVPMDTQTVGTHFQGRSAPSDPASEFPANPQQGIACDMQTPTGNSSPRAPLTMIGMPNSLPTHSEDIIDAISRIPDTNWETLSQGFLEMESTLRILSDETFIPVLHLINLWRSDEGLALSSNNCRNIYYDYFKTYLDQELIATFGDNVPGSYRVSLKCDLF
jgi:hypothetical protein